MHIKLIKEDIKVIKSLKLKKYLNINKEFIFYGILNILISSVSFYLILKYNNTHIKWKEFIELLVLIILILGFIFSLEKRVLEEKVFYKRYSYLIDDFKINIDELHKIIILNSKGTEIKVLINKDNIKIDEKFIILFTNKDIVGIIPRTKLSDKKEESTLINLLDKYMEV